METMISPSSDKRISTRLFKKLNLPDRIADRKEGTVLRRQQLTTAGTISSSSFMRREKTKSNARLTKYDNNSQLAIVSDFQTFLGILNTKLIEIYTNLVD